MEVESTHVQTLENGRKLIDVTMRPRPRLDDHKQQVRGKPSDWADGEVDDVCVLLKASDRSAAV